MTETKTAGATHPGSIPGVSAVLAAFARSGVGAAADTAAATRSLIDTVGVALGARTGGTVSALLRWTTGEGSVGLAAAWGGGTTTGPSHAALLNGTAAHALDFDDAVPSMPLHPATVLWPALLAAAPEQLTDPARLVDAFCVGNAVMRAVGELLPMDAHYGAGWHSTSTVGRIAAVAALAHLHDLDELSTRHALGLVASTASGSIANFGTDTKPLHAGLAARDAVAAVAMVRAGMDANPDQLEHRLGFLAQFGEPTEEGIAGFADALVAAATTWTSDWTIKRYAACYGTHRAVDGALLLAARLGAVEPRDIESITVHSHPGGLRPLRTELPTTGTQAKFSLPYVAVRALTDAALGLEAFTDEAVADAEVLAAAERVDVRGERVPPGREDLAGLPYGRIEVRLRDGRSDAEFVEITRGDARNPMSDDEIDEKFRSCLGAGGYSAAETENLLGGLRAALTDPAALAAVATALSQRPAAEGAQA